MSSNKFSTVVRYAFASGHSSIGALKGRSGSIVPIEYCRRESQLMGEKPPLESSFSDSASQIKLQSPQLKSFGFDKIGHSL